MFTLVVKIAQIPLLLTIAASSLIFSIVFLSFQISFMKRRDLGQFIRSWGPDMHSDKQGIPTMGGISFLLAFGLGLSLAWLFSPSIRNKILLFTCGTFGAGLIGLSDDLLSLIRQRSIGLSVTQKVVSQITIGAGFFLGCLAFLQNPLMIRIPILSTPLELHPVLMGVITVVIYISSVNAVNLTDGLDGLAAGAGLIAVVAFATLSPISELSIYTSMGISLLGFLWYNFYPAQVFMGDVGAFAIGGFLTTAAISNHARLLLPVIGGLFVIETCSVISQITSLKLTGKRLFKITPFHHHFEEVQGIDYEFVFSDVSWSEPKITIRFWIVEGCFALCGTLLCIYG